MSSIAILIIRCKTAYMIWQRQLLFHSVARDTHRVCLVPVLPFWSRTLTQARNSGSGLYDQSFSEGVIDSMDFETRGLVVH